MSIKMDRRMMYKNNARCSSMRKDMFLKKCIDQLRETRLDRQNAHRNFDQYQMEAASVAKTLIDAEMGESTPEERMAMYESLVEELVQEEFEEFETTQEENDQKMIDRHLSFDALCPKCRLNPLKLDITGMKCSVCPFAHQFADRRQVRNSRQLMDIFTTAFTNHAETGCQSMPDPTSQEGNLIIKCSKCPFNQKAL